MGEPRVFLFYYCTAFRLPKKHVHEYTDVTGKDDKADAKRIALYGFRMRDEITPTVLSSEEEQNIKRLLSLRQRLVKQRAGYKASLKEQERVLNKKLN